MSDLDLAPPLMILDHMKMHAWYWSSVNEDLPERAGFVQNTDNDSSSVIQDEQQAPLDAIENLNAERDIICLNIQSSAIQNSYRKVISQWRKKFPAGTILFHASARTIDVDPAKIDVSIIEKCEKSGPWESFIHVKTDPVCVSIANYLDLGDVDGVARHGLLKLMVSNRADLASLVQSADGSDDTNQNLIQKLEQNGFLDAYRNDLKMLTDPNGPSWTWIVKQSAEPGEKTLVELTQILVNTLRETEESTSVDDLTHAIESIDQWENALSTTRTRADG